MVLAACSPYFYAMFNSFEESKQDRITLQGVDYQALLLLVEYVYTSEVQVTEENVQVCYLIINHLRLFSFYLIGVVTCCKYITTHRCPRCLL